MLATSDFDIQLTWRILKIPVEFKAIQRQLQVTLFILVSKSYLIPPWGDHQIDSQLAFIFSLVLQRSNEIGKKREGWKEVKIE